MPDANVKLTIVDTKYLYYGIISLIEDIGSSAIEIGRITGKKLQE